MADKQYIVTGPVVVLPIEGGSERYLYRGAVITTGYTADGIKHALSVGLIKVVPVAPTEAQKAAAEKAEAERAAEVKRIADEAAAKLAAEKNSK